MSHNNPYKQFFDEQVALRSYKPKEAQDAITEGSSGIKIAGTKSECRIYIEKEILIELIYKITLPRGKNNPGIEFEFSEESLSIKNDPLTSLKFSSGEVVIYNSRGMEDLRKVSDFLMSVESYSNEGALMISIVQQMLESPTHNDANKIAKYLKNSHKIDKVTVEWD